MVFLLLIEDALWCSMESDFPKMSLVFKDLNSTCESEAIFGKTHGRSILQSTSKIHVSLSMFNMAEK